MVCKYLRKQVDQIELGETNYLYLDTKALQNFHWNKLQYMACCDLMKINQNSSLLNVHLWKTLYMFFFVFF